MRTFLLIAQIIIASSLIVVILLQAKGTGLGSAFGGGGQVYRSKRGIEKVILYTTIVLIALFFIVSILQVII